MTISSMDNLISALSAGNYYRCDWNKNVLPTTTQAAGSWYYLGLGTGAPTMDSTIGCANNLSQVNTSFTSTFIANTTALNGNITTTVFTDTAHQSGRFTVGMMLSGGSVLAGTYIVSLGTGTGNNAGGTYNINLSQTVTSNSIVGTAYPNGLYTGGTNDAVSPSIKTILNASAFSAAPTTAPCVFLLIDVLATIPISTVTTTGAQSIVNQTSWPRYATGTGVQAFLTPSIVMGAGTPTVQLGYTNAAGTASRLTPTTPSLPIITATCPIGMIPYTGTGAGKVGPFLPLQAGDTGIQSIQSINFNATMTSGCMNIIVCRPLMYLPISTVGVSAERDFLNQLPSLPVINDGSNLQWLMYAGVNTPVNSAFYGNIDCCWG